MHLSILLRKVKKTNISRTAVNYVKSFLDLITSTYIIVSEAFVGLSWTIHYASHKEIEYTRWPK